MQQIVYFKISNNFGSMQIVKISFSLKICSFYASVSNQFLSAINTFLHVSFWLVSFSVCSLNYVFVVFPPQIVIDNNNNNKISRKTSDICAQKQTNLLVQLNLMFFIFFLLKCCCASSLSSLVHQVKFYWHLNAMAMASAHKSGQTKLSVLKLIL